MTRPNLGGKTMIKRQRYSKEAKERLALEMISGQTSTAEISKREMISVATLSRWKRQLVSEGFEDKNGVELELRKKISYLESALSDLMIENQILKKTEKLLQEYRQKEKLSRIASAQNLGSQGVAEL